MTPLALTGTDIADQKMKQKTLLQEELGWTPEPKRAMVCIPTGISDTLGGALLKEILPGLLTLPIQIVILGKGSASYGEYLTEMADAHDQQIAIISNDEKHIRTMFASSDIALFLTDATSLPELDASLRYVTVPVCPHVKGLRNYDPNQESGEIFEYDKATVWHCFAAVVRALETYRFPFDWKTIQKHGLEKK